MRKANYYTLLTKEEEITRLKSISEEDSYLGLLLKKDSTVDYLVKSWTNDEAPEYDPIAYFNQEKQLKIQADKIDELNRKIVELNQDIVILYSTGSLLQS